MIWMYMFTCEMYFKYFDIIQVQNIYIRLAGILYVNMRGF